MRKRVLLALVLVITLVMSTGCSLIIKDEAVDRATPIIEVAGKTITKGEIQAQTEAILNYNEQMYAYYGMNYDRTSETVVANAQDQAIEGLIQNAVVDAKLADYGFDTFTDEEMVEIEASAQEDYQLYHDTIKNFYFSDTELTGDELEAAIQEEMTAMGYPDYETLVQEARYAKSQEKLKAEINKDVTVSEEELTTEYNARVERDKTSYETTPASYGTALTNGTTPYYTPAGYRYVKHILLKFTQEDETAMDELETAISEKQTAIDNLAQDEDATALKDELADLQAKLETARKAAYAKLQPKVDEITAKLAEGEDFNQLITEYNEDPGMTAESTGYAVSADSTNWVDEFKTASMKLSAIGDVSGAVRSEYGIHIIRYESDIAEGEIGLEAVRESLTAELQETKESENIQATLDRWVEEANAVINRKELQ
ncbi:MAG: peptidylprolyl isomerase [Clostridia bacterium]|nr:peptidylprolyl isomerase [Clostridia bacterium]